MVAVCCGILMCVRLLKLAYCWQANEAEGESLQHVEAAFAALKGAASGAPPNCTVASEAIRTKPIRYAYQPTDEAVRNAKADKIIRLHEFETYTQARSVPATIWVCSDGAEVVEAVKRGILRDVSVCVQPTAGTSFSDIIKDTWESMTGYRKNFSHHTQLAKENAALDTDFQRVELIAKWVDEKCESEKAKGNIPTERDVSTWHSELKLAIGRSAERVTAPGRIGQALVRDPTARQSVKLMLMLARTARADLKTKGKAFTLNHMLGPQLETGYGLVWGPALDGGRRDAVFYWYFDKLRSSPSQQITSAEFVEEVRKTIDKHMGSCSGALNEGAC